MLQCIAYKRTDWDPLWASFNCLPSEIFCFSLFKTGKSVTQIRETGRVKFAGTPVPDRVYNVINVCAGEWDVIEFCTFEGKNSPAFHIKYIRRIKRPILRIGSPLRELLRWPAEPGKKCRICTKFMSPENKRQVPFMSWSANIFDSWS